MSKPSSPMRQVMRWLVLGNVDSEETVDGEPVRVGADQAGGAAIGEDEEREHLFELVGLLKVERAEFEVEDEHLCLGFGADDVMRGFERIDGGVAAHEADHGALDGGREAEMADDFEVQAGRVEASARGDDDVGDGAALARQ